MLVRPLEHPNGLIYVHSTFSLRARSRTFAGLARLDERSGKGRSGVCDRRIYEIAKVSPITGSFCRKSHRTFTRALSFFFSHYIRCSVRPSSFTLFYK
jgi:hypothetical protein